MMSLTAGALMVSSEPAPAPMVIEPVSLEENEINILKGAHVEIANIKNNNPDWKNTITLNEAGTYNVWIRYSFENKHSEKTVCYALDKPPVIKNWGVFNRLVEYDKEKLSIEMSPKMPSSLYKIGRQALLFSDWYMNDRKIPVPMEGMVYKTIQGIPKTTIKDGSNYLIGKFSVKVTENKNEEKETRYDPSDETKLLAMSDEDLKFKIGPIVGFSGSDFLTLSCRLNMPAEVSLFVNKTTYFSPSGMTHQFKIEGLHADTCYSYILKANIVDTKTFISVGPFKTKTLPSNNKLKVVVMADAQVLDLKTGKWPAVANAVLKESPDMILFAGDMVNRGMIDYTWDISFLGMAPELFSSIPFYAVRGNHEDYSSGWGRGLDCPIFTKLFITPNGKSNWQQKIGNTLFVGIDGKRDWTTNSPDYRWLESILSKKDSTFSFVITHFPPSGVAPEEQKEFFPHESKMAAKYLLPLMEKYKVTAMLCGHQHTYERFSWSENVDVIVNGGAGGRFTIFDWKKGKENPSLRKFVPKQRQYVILDINEKKIVMTAKNIKGEVIDSKVWE